MAGIPSALLLLESSQGGWALVNTITDKGGMRAELNLPIFMNNFLGAQATWDDAYNSTFESPHSFGIFSTNGSNLIKFGQSSSLKKGYYYVVLCL